MNRDAILLIFKLRKEKTDSTTLFITPINSLASATSGPLLQYPVFPWVLADYTSARLDLTRAASFRDLRCVCNGRASIA
jgi:hypothetical protein